jgi:hypothetical protein
MPLKSGKSKKVISENIEELHHGKTYSKTKKKFGAKKANAQAVAIAYAKAGKSKKRKSHKNRKHQLSHEFGESGY